MSAPSDPLIAPATLAQQHRVLFAPGQVIELRALDVRRGGKSPHTEAGFFDVDHLHDMARVALEVSPYARGVYFTLNPLNPVLLARRANRIDWAREGELAKDKDILNRRWLFVDADPFRDPHVSATDEEKVRARSTCIAVREHLRANGWPDPILADSGNGYHLFYRVELPANDEGLIERVLRALASRFDTGDVTIDRSVHNAARICKLPGTIARKGDHTPERPHRQATFVEGHSAGELRPVPNDLLEAVAGECPTPSSLSSCSVATSWNGTSPRLRVDQWLADRGVVFRVKSEPDAKGRRVYVLGACPFDPGHGDPDACVMQAPNGQMSAKCFHNSCSGRGWQEFKNEIGPPDRHHYDPPRTPRCPASPPASASQVRGSSGPLATDALAADTRPTIRIDASTRVGDTMSRITDVLLTAGDCFRRTEQLVRINGTTITPILSAADLAGLLNHHVEFLFDRGEVSEYKPLPTNYANTWLKHPSQTTRLPVIRLFSLNPVYSDNWRAASPGYDPASGIYYAGPHVEPRAGRAYLDALLKDFCFRTAADRTDYVGMLLTLVLMPHFIGSKPAVLFNGNQPGLGKSILAQIIAILRDAQTTETATYNSNDEEFEKRLGAIVHRGATTIIIDNAKGKGRSPRIDSACLERSITDPVLSFRLLGYSREIRAENSHIFCITANTPDISRDLVTRSVVVELYYEGDPLRRVFSIPDPEAYTEAHRVALLGELVGMVERWRAEGSPMANVHSRFNKKGWARIVGGILTVNGFRDFLANAESTAAELDDTMRDFAHLVALMADHEQGSWTAAELADVAGTHGLFPSEFADASPRARSTRMGLIAGRFVGERFVLPSGHTRIFQRTEDRKGKVYHVAIDDDDRMNR